MADQSDRLGSSGVFKAIVDGARKLKRALSEDESELTPEVNELGNKIGQAFVAGRFADIHELGTQALRQRKARDPFATSWKDAIRDRTPLTGFQVSDAGQIDLGFIPGLEDAAQASFVAFLEIAFSSPNVSLEDAKAFTIGVVLLDEGGQIRVGAIHAR